MSSYLDDISEGRNPFRDDPHWKPSDGPAKPIDGWRQVDLEEAIREAIEKEQAQ